MNKNELFKNGEVFGIGIEKLRESGTNPRKTYDKKGLEELAESIRTKGVIQPLLVRGVGVGKPDLDGGYEVVAGSRRFRAAKLAGLKEIPCIVRDYSDAEVIEIQVIENNQREDITPLEEADGYAQLLKIDGYSIEVIAGKIGRSDKYVRERLQLAKLIPEVHKAFESGKILYTHARLFSRLPAEKQKQAFSSVVKSWQGTHVSTVTLENWIKQNVEQDLTKAKFDLKDKLLVPEAGACNECPKNTACDNQLFPDYAKKKICTDAKCFANKIKVHIEKRVSELKSSGAEFEMLNNGWVNERINFGGKEVSTIGQNNYDEAKKKDKSAVLGIVVSGSLTALGEEKWVKLKKKDSSTGTKSSRKEKKETPEAKKRAEEKETFEKAVNSEVMRRTAVLLMSKAPPKLVKKDLYEIMRRFDDSDNYSPELLSAITGLKVNEIENDMSRDRDVEDLKKELLKLDENTLIKGLKVFIENDGYYWGVNHKVIKKYKIDVKKIEKEVRGEKPKNEPVKAKKGKKK